MRALNSHLNTIHETLQVYYWSPPLRMYVLCLYMCMILGL